MTRFEAMTALDNMTSSNTQQQAIDVMMSYMVNYDPALVLGMYSVLGRVSQTPVLITLSAAVVAQATAGRGTDSGFTNGSL